MSIKFAAIGFAHDHIFNMVNVLLAAGAQLIYYYDDVPERLALFKQRFPQASLAPNIESILENKQIDLIVCAAIPTQRADLAIRAMQAGKDILCAKPAFTTMAALETVKQVQQETQRIFSVYYGERLGSSCTVKAGELVQSGAIGQVIQTVGFGPHRLLGNAYRPAWIFERESSGGLINDLASHQIDQFLYFTKSESAEIVAAHLGNFKHPQFPKMHDFGDLTLKSAHATAYIRVDWLTPEGLSTWGDVRLFILGTEGTIELRKNIDLLGHEGANHLFLVDKSGMNYIDCQHVPLPFATQFIDDIRNRSESAMSQAHCFLTSELALKAEWMAQDLTNVGS